MDYDSGTAKNGNEKKESNSNFKQNLPAAVFVTIILAMFTYLLNLGAELRTVAGKCDAGLAEINGTQLRDHVINLNSSMAHLTASVTANNMRIDTAFNQLNSAADAIIAHSKELSFLQQERRRSE